MISREHKSAFAFLVFVLSMLTLYRAWVIAHHALPLYLDEAQYWTWSLKPDWGYYSKPPMIAWVIRLFSGFGDHELAVRLGTLLLHPLTAVVLYALGRRMFDVRTGLYAAILFASLPLVGFNSLFMTTDAPLFFFWGLACFALWRVLQTNAWVDWLLLGFAAGMGLLSKYSMAAFAPSVALLLCLPAYRKQWLNPRLYVAAVVALLVFAPNVWWNAQMDFVSFRHTAEISQLDKSLIHPAKLAEFVAGQFGCMGPIAFAFLLAALVSPVVWRDPKLGFLASLSLPFLALIALQALLAKANVNWAAPTYFAATLLVAARWIASDRRRWYRAAVISNLMLLSIFYHYRPLADVLGIPLTRKTDPYARVLGWPQLGQALSRVMAEQGDARLAVIDRGEFALLGYYVRPRPREMRIWNPLGKKQNHFQLVADMKNEIGSSFVFASLKPLDGEGGAERAVAKSFEGWASLGTVSVPLYPGEMLKLYLYRGDRFKGYSQ